MACPWCKHRLKSCTESEAVDCDFKSLVWDQQAILERASKELKQAQEEVQHIDELSERDTFILFDRLSGVAIMTKVLKEEFGMSEDELKEALPKFSFLAKAKLLTKIKLMEKKRRKI